MKFVCGNCNELIREVDSPMAFAGWQRHDACKTDTYFERFIVRPGQKDAHPVAVRVREAGSEGEGVPIASWIKKFGHGVKEVAGDVVEVVADIALHNITGGDSSLPSAADLDAVAAEQKVATETGAPREKRRGRK